MTKGLRIKQLRESLGISQTAFAERINVSKQTLYKYENDIITNIPSDKIEAIAEITGSTPAYIMGWDEDDVPDQEPGYDKLLVEFNNIYKNLPDEVKQNALDYLKLLEKQFGGGE